MAKAIRAVPTVLLVVLAIARAATSQTAEPAGTDPARVEVSFAPVITSVGSADSVRFTSAAAIAEMRVQVFAPDGGAVFDSGWKGGNVIDWPLTNLGGGPVAPGSYTCTVAARDLAGHPTLKRITLDVLDSATPVKLGPGGDRVTVDPAMTVVAHDGTSGEVVSTSGDLLFATGDVFGGAEKEGMRLTSEGNLGVGTREPQARLDVNGLIRTSEGIVLPDGTVLRSATAPAPTGIPASPRPGAQMAAADFQPQVSGTGTANRLTKWQDTAGTLVDSAVSEVGGRVGIGTDTPSGTLHIFGAAGLDLFLGMGVDLAAGPAFNFGYSGGSFGRSSGFFNVRPDVSAVAPNPSLRFLTSNVQRMIITNTGNLGIATLAPGFLVTLGGSANRTVGMERNTGGSGNSLTLQGSSATAGATDLRGGDLFLAAGIGTGLGGGGDIRLRSSGANDVSGSADGAVVDRHLIVGKAKSMTLSTTGSANIMSLQLSGTQTAGGRIRYTIRATDGGSQVATETGVIVYLATAGSVTCAAPPDDKLHLGTVNSGCAPGFFNPGTQPGIAITDNVVFVTPATPAVHEVYYTIENESGAPVRLEP